MPRSAPPLRLLVTEPVRAVVEYARMRLTAFDDLPRGENHPVVIFPGLATDRRFTAPLARHCRALGYRTHDWGRGWNRGPEGDVAQWFDALARDVRALAGRKSRKLTLIGWSLGGIYAREIAKRIPHAVRHVVTIGSPFAGTAEHTNVGWLYRLLSGNEPKLDRDLAAELRRPPPVPTTSIYSRTDGVVAWRACRQVRAPRTENIEVTSSHLGLVFHPDVLEIIADRLAQPEGQWQPYARRVRAARAA